MVKIAKDRKVIPDPIDDSKFSMKAVMIRRRPGKISPRVDSASDWDGFKVNSFLCHPRHFLYP